MTAEGGQVRSTRPAILLALIPVLDSAINQVAGVEAAIGSLSVFQVARGAELGLLLIVATWAILRRPKIDSQLLSLATVMGAAVICILSSEFRVYGSVGVGSMVGGVQLLYVVVLWITASVICTRPKDGFIVLRGIAFGALLTALSILVAYFRRTNLTEVYHGIAATSGLFFSAKYLIGTLVLGGFAWMYLCTRRFRALGTVAACLCFLALMATYNRTGQVCLAVSLLWLAGWYLRVAQRRDAAWTRRLLMLASATLILALAFVGTTDFSQRWADLAERDTAGSGRILLWAIATNWLVEAGPVNFLAGAGFRGMFDTIDSAIGHRIHTHSDLFDFLMLAGLFGGFAYVWLARTLYVIVKRTDPSSSAYALGFVAFITYFLSSLLTGQITQPTAMASYVLTVAALGAIGRAQRYPSPVREILGTPTTKLAGGL